MARPLYCGSGLSEASANAGEAVLMQSARSSRPEEGARRWLRLALVAAAGMAVLGQANVTPSPGLKDECEIAGLATYVIEETLEASCSESSYIRACSEAQRTHRERCGEFCSSFKSLRGSSPCLGASKPTAHLFEPAQHCVETRREQFLVTCQVAAPCACTPTDPR